MLRDEGFKPKTKTINLLLLDGGLGDHVGSLVAVDYIIKNYTWIKPLIWVPDYLVDFAKNVLPEDSIVKSFTQMRGQYEPTKPTKTTKWDGITSPMKLHCVDYAFLKLCDEAPDIEHKNYLQIKLDKIVSKDFDLPEKYVVITTGFTADVREFRAEHVNGIAAYCVSKGYTPVFLGQKHTKTGAAHTIEGKFKEGEINYAVGIDLIDKTNLLEAATIMHHSAAVVGADNGLLHVAGCTQAPIVGGFTTVSPEIRMPIRNNILGWNYYSVVPDKSLSCRFCQEKTNFLYGHDYRNCIYKDNLCTKQLTDVKFIGHLKGLLK